jgi:glycosyltransferase involved in cell wall biosynthesis
VTTAHRLDPTTTPSWDGLVVVMATSFWDGTPLLERHLARELTAYAPLLYVEPPISVMTRLRNREVARTAPTPGLRLVEPGLAVLTVRLPPLKDRPWAKPVSLALLRRALRRAVARLGDPEVAATVVTSLDPVLGTLHERVSVYYAKDDYVAGADLLGLPVAAVDDYVSRLCASAGLVVAVSPTLATSLAARGVEPVVIPNGCDASLFSQATLPAPTTVPTAAFVGHLSDRVDVTMLQAVVDAGVHLRLVGPVQETMSQGHFDALLAHERVDWLGARPHSELPEVLSDVTTCLLPYADTAFNRASFPLKALEYLAAGRRVVGTDLPALRWLDTDLVTTTSDVPGFAAAVRESLTTPLTAEEVAARREFAAGHSWQQRAHTFAVASGLAPVSGART